MEMQYLIVLSLYFTMTQGLIHKNFQINDLQA